MIYGKRQGLPLLHSPSLIFDLGNYSVNLHANKCLPPPEALIEVMWKKFVTTGVHGP